MHLIRRNLLRNRFGLTPTGPQRCFGRWAGPPTDPVPPAFIKGSKEAFESLPKR